MTNRTDLAKALARYAKANGHAEANLLLLHSLAAARDPSLIEALRNLRASGTDRGVHLGVKSAAEICDRLAELTQEAI